MEKEKIEVKKEILKIIKNLNDEYLINIIYEYLLIIKEKESF